MLAIYFLGLGVICLLAGTCGYSLNIFEMSILGLASFAFYNVVSRKKKAFLGVVGILVIVMIGAHIYLIRVNQLITFYEPVINYLKAYYYSVTEEGYYIGRAQQGLVVLLVSLGVYKVIFNLYNSSKYKMIAPIIGVGITIIGFFTDSLSSASDHLAFKVFVVAVVIYYFEIYYIRIKNVHIQPEKRPFYFMGLFMGIAIIVLASFVHNVMPNPFMKRVKSVAVKEGSHVDTALDHHRENDEVVYQIGESYEVQSSFVHKGIRLFSVKTTDLKYYRSQTFNIYENGIWTNTKKSNVDRALWPYFEEGISEEALANSDLFHSEEVEVIYENVVTDALISAPFTGELNMGEEQNYDIYLLEDGTYGLREMAGSGFAYTLQAYIPKYRTELFADYVKHTKADSRIIHKDYLNVPDGYESITVLAEDITQGLIANNEKAIAIEKYLKENYTYNDEPGYVSTGDMVPEFLLEKQEGFCQQFASSMAIMLRAVDVPTRFVVGYVIDVSLDEEDIPYELLNDDEFNPYFNIYDHNSHAWVEVYEEGIGWMQYEPTPGQNVVQYYDRPTREALEEKEQLEKENDEVGQIVRYGYIFMGVFIILLIIYTIYKIVALNRKRRNNTVGMTKFYYKAILMYMKAYKYPKESCETIQEYGKRLNSFGNLPIYQEFQKLVPVFESVFYAGLVPDKKQVETLEDYMGILRTKVRRNLHPIRFMRLITKEYFLKYKK